MSAKLTEALGASNCVVQEIRALETIGTVMKPGVSSSTGPRDAVRRTSRAAVAKALASSSSLRSSEGRANCRCAAGMLPSEKLKKTALNLLRKCQRMVQDL